MFAAAVAACAVGWFAYERIERWYRQARADRLTVAALRAPDDQAAAAIGRLPDLGAAGVERLAWLACQPRGDLATPARRELDTRLQQWLTQWRDTGNADHLTEPLLRTLAVLRAQADQITADDIRWCEHFALASSELSAALPPREAAKLIADCEAVLAVLPRRTGRTHTADPAQTAGAVDLQAPTIGVQAWGGTANSRPSAQTSSPWGDAPPALPGSMLPPDVTARSTAAAPQRRDRASAVPADDPVAEPRRVDSEDEVGATALPRRTSPLAAGPGQNRMTSPRLTPVPTPLEVREQSRVLQKAPTEVLLRQLPAADRFQAAAIQRELAARGVPTTGLTPSAPDSATTSAQPPRQTLAERVAQMPAGEGRRMVRLLTESGDARTRLEALTLLATMQDPQLADIARRRAVHDADSRVAERATEILEATKR